MVTQVYFARGRLHGDAWHIQCIVRTVHAALGRGLFVLLNGHDGSLKALDAARSKKDAASELEKVCPDIPSEAIDYSPTWGLTGLFKLQPRQSREGVGAFFLFLFKLGVFN